MSEGSLKRLDAGAFLELATQCGLELRELDLAQLSRRKLVSPQEPKGGGESFYTAMHLFVVAQYLRAVRPLRHPWSSRAAELTLEDVSATSERVNALLRHAEQGGGGEGLQEIEVLFREIEDFLARIDPFGPLGELFDFLQPKVREGIRNSGRLYLELRRAASESARRLDQEEASDDMPMTQPMFGIDDDAMGTVDDFRSTQVIGEVEKETSEAARRAIDSVLDAASEVFDGDEEVEVQDLEDVDLAATQVVEVDLEQWGAAGLAEESSEPVVLEVAGPPELPPESTASPAERIAELNRLRETYLREKKWQELADLYEEGMELFTDPEERQKVDLVLAMLYEVKLRQKEKAFDAFVRAWDLREVEAGRTKAFEGLKRLGRSGGLHDRYMEWAQQRLATELEKEERAQIQREFSLALYADKQYERAFMTFAAFLAEDPAGSVTEETLAQLEKLGGRVDSTEMQRFLRDLLLGELDEGTRELVEGLVEGPSD